MNHGGGVDMPIYRFEAKVIGRAERGGGRSVVACAAYRSASSLYDDKYALRHDYSRREAGLAYSAIVAPDGAPSWVYDRQALWNAVELKEDQSRRRASAQLAREFIISLPKELDREQRQELVLGFVHDELTSRGMISDISIHEPREGDNFHCHILCSMREIGSEGFGNKVRDWNDKDTLVAWRKSWEEHCNKALEDAGETARVDSRSLADQGSDKEPMPKIGVAAAAMERRGIETQRGIAARAVNYFNQVKDAIRGIVLRGEIAEYPAITTGSPQPWWQRAWYSIEEGFEAVRDTAVTILHDSPSSSWVDKENTRRSDPEPDMS